MNLSTLVKTNLIISNRESVNAILSYFLYALMSLFLVGLILFPLFIDAGADRNLGLTLFIPFLCLYDYMLTQAKLRAPSLVDRFPFSLFPVSRTRSLSLRFLLFLLDKRILFYLLPMLGVMIIFAAGGHFAEMLAALLLFAAMYLAMSAVFFLVYLMFRKLADRFGVRAAAQISSVPFVLVALLASAAHDKSAMVALIPIVSQFTNGFQEILASHIGAALLEGGYLFGVFLLGASLLLVVGLLVEEVAARNWIRLGTLTRMRVAETSRAAAPALVRRDEISLTTGERSFADDGGIYSREPAEPASRAGWHIVLVDWLVHQREEKILYLILLYPLMAIFGIIKLATRLHFELGSLILPIFVFTQILGFYFAENHFTGHGLRLSHIVLTPLDPFRFVFSKTLSTWGLLSLMNVFVCLFCGAYLDMSFNTLVHGTLYSLFLPLVLLQLANTLSLYSPGISRHPMISLVVIITLELILSAIYVLAMWVNLILGMFFVAVIFYASLFYSLPAWGRQLSRQAQILLEYRK